MASFEHRGNSVRAIVRTPKGKVTATFDTEREARAWAATIEAKKATMRPGKGGTNAELFETFLDAVASKTDTAKWNRLRLLKWCTDPVASVPTGDTTTHDINAWIARSLAQGLASSTVNRELNLMSAAFNYGVKALQWATTNPCHGAARPERGRPRKRPLLTQQEIRAIRIATGFDADPKLKTLTARVGACFLLSLETGMRSGELLRLRPSDYHRDQAYIHVSATERGGRKGARSGRGTVDPSRDVPLTKTAIELLDSLLASMPAAQEPRPELGMSQPPYIVGLTDGQRDTLWRKARDKAGVEDLHFHDTKHEAATRLSKFIDVLALSHAIGTKDVRLLRDTYYNSDAARTAKILPAQLSTPVGDI